MFAVPLRQPPRFREVGSVLERANIFVLPPLSEPLIGKNLCQPCGTSQRVRTRPSHPIRRNHYGAIVIICSCGADRPFPIWAVQSQGSPFHCSCWPLLNLRLRLALLRPFELCRHSFLISLRASSWIAGIANGSC